MRERRWRQSYKVCPRGSTFRLFINYFYFIYFSESRLFLIRKIHITISCGLSLSNFALKMGLISGVFMGMIFGIALMAGWRHMMRYRSTKRIAKVLLFFFFSIFYRNQSVLFVNFCLENFTQLVSVFFLACSIDWMCLKIWTFGKIYQLNLFWIKIVIVEIVTITVSLIFVAAFCLKFYVWLLLYWKFWTI